MTIDVFRVLFHVWTMPRKLRLEYDGAIYHVLSRGDRREAIFLGDADRELFLRTLGEACKKTDWQIHAYCLMKNHFHLVIETPKANLSHGMQWLLGTYTARFNRRHQISGHVFSGRYKSFVLDGSGNGYLKTVCDYVHLNPVRANLLPPGQSLQDYAWSSYPDYLKPPAKRPSWLRVDRLSGEWGIGSETTNGRRRFHKLMEERTEQERVQEGKDWKKLRRSWCFGRKEFLQEMLDLIAEKHGEQHHGEEIRESGKQKADRFVLEMIRTAGWNESDLLNRLKCDQKKVRMAGRLRAETTMTWRWIAGRLAMGHWRTAANAVRMAQSTSRK